MNFNTSYKNTQTYWSNITWTFLHSFPLALNNEFYDNYKTQILSLLYDICINVPCPLCSNHATKTLKKYNYFHESINTTTRELSLNIFRFHNEVNKMLNKPLFNDTILNNYNNIDFQSVYNEWCDKFTIKTINLKLYYHKKNVNLTRSKVINFVNHNIKHFKINKTNQKTIQHTHQNIYTPTKPPSKHVKTHKTNTIMKGMFLK